MNIKNINSNVYRKYINSGSANVNCSQKIFSLSGQKTGIKKDSLSFSSEAALLRSNSKAVKEYASEIMSPASDERINELRRKIKGGEYNVGSKEIADSILNRYV